MPSNDVRVLTGGKPSGRRRQQIVSGTVSSNQPAPSSFEDPLYVVIDGITTERYYTFAGGEWPADHGATLPVPGTPVHLAYDENDVLSVTGWEGAYTDPSSVQSVVSLQPLALPTMLSSAPPTSDTPSGQVSASAGADRYVTVTASAAAACTVYLVSVSNAGLIFGAFPLAASTVQQITMPVGACLCWSGNTAHPPAWTAMGL